MTGSGDIGGPAEWQRSDAPAQPACLDGGPPTATGDGDADASTAAPATDPDESPDYVARRRAAWYRADVDPAFHVPIRDMQQETDA
jgi:hypothetical protein